MRNSSNRSRENTKCRIPKESPYAYSNYRYQNAQLIWKHCSVSSCAPFNTSAEALSFLLQLLDRSFFRINASGLQLHCGVTLVAPSGNWVFSERLLLLPVPLWQKNAKNMHLVNLFPFYIGRLPSLKQPKLLPARTLQPKCSGMFFRWAGIQRPNSQKLAIHANRVEELKENNGRIDFYLSGISMNKFWFCLSSFLMKYV